MDEPSIIVKPEIIDSESSDDLSLESESDEEQSTSCIEEGCIEEGCTEEGCTEEGCTEEGPQVAHSSNANIFVLPDKPSGPNSRLSAYNKSEILKCLMANGCTAKSTTEAISRFKVEPESLLDYFNKQAEQAQLHVGEECGSLCFENVGAWLSCLERMGLHVFCDFEPALVIKTIAESEHPSPSEIGGIDLKSIYTFLGNALLGLPQTELSPESAQFLTAEFEELIDDVNTDLAESQTKQIKDMLNKNNKPSIEESKLREKLSLDPLGIDNDITKFL